MNKTIYGDYIITDEQFSRLNFRLENIKRSINSQRAFIEDESGERIQLNVYREEYQGFIDTKTLNFIVVSSSKPDGHVTLDFDEDEEEELRALGYNSILDVSISDFNDRFDPKGE